jgi:hypothetical protein
VVPPYNRAAMTGADASLSQEARVRLRKAHGVRPVHVHEEGFAAADLPAGTYGFTGSPGLAAPLFAEQRYRNFEIHRLDGTEVAIVGFVSARDLALLRDAREVVPVTIYPDAEGEALEIVSIPYSRIAQHRQYSILNAAAMTLRVWPLAEPAAV